MKRETTFLKVCLLFIGIGILALSGLLFYLFHKEAQSGSMKMAIVLYGILGFMYTAAIPFYIALFNAFKLLCHIDTNKAFSELSVTALRNIKRCAMVISLIYALSMPLFYIVGEVDDAPGVILVGLFFVFSPLVVSVFAAVLQKLFENALEIKKDNELTI